MKLSALLLRRDDGVDPAIETAGMFVGYPVPVLANGDPERRIGVARAWRNSSGDLVFDADLSDQVWDGMKEREVPLADYLGLNLVPVAMFAAYETIYGRDGRRFIRRSQLMAIGLRIRNLDQSIPSIIIITPGGEGS